MKSDEPVARKALRIAERGAKADASKLVEAVPEALREARRRRERATDASASLAQLSARAMPRLAAATALAVIAATGVVLWEQRGAGPKATTLESVIFGSENGTGDPVLDALIAAGRTRG